MKIWIVVEDCCIWGAFSKEEDAKKFAVREFGTFGGGVVLPKVLRLTVYESLSEAPTTIEDSLKETLSW